MASLDAELRSVLESAQAAVWDWDVPTGRFEVDESWLRTLGVDAGPGGGALSTTEWKRRIHPDDHGAFAAATESCHHGGERFECEYRLLAAGHRWLWVLHRGRVTRARSRRLRGAPRRTAARHRPPQGRRSRAQRQRIPPRHRALGRAGGILAMARSEQRAHRESVVAGDDRLLARAVGGHAQSLAQQSPSGRSRSRRPPAAGTRARSARLRGIRIPLP